MKSLISYLISYVILKGHVTEIQVLSPSYLGCQLSFKSLRYNCIGIITFSYTKTSLHFSQAGSQGIQLYTQQILSWLVNCYKVSSVTNKHTRIVSNRIS